MSTRFLGSGVWAACANKCALRGVINLESVGYVGANQDFPGKVSLKCFGKHDGICLQYDGICTSKPCGDFLAILSDKNSVELGQACFKQCRSVPIPVILANIKLDVSEIREHQEHLGDILRADHVPFWERGIPAITLTDTANLRTPYYHFAKDTIDKLNWRFASNVCKATVRTVSD